LEESLKQQVIGQDDAVRKIARAMRRNRLGIKDPNKPIGSFIFLGSTGVGKTHLAKELAKQIFGSADNLIRVDMSEYQEKHSVSRLIGAPPGYVGYDEGGQLTEQVKNKPYSVVLFDEVEKANKEIFHTLLQMLDEGHLTDSLGRKINFKNTLIIMTSNIGVKKLQDFGTGIGFGGSSYSTEEQKKEILKKEMKNYFSPEFINRIDETIIFNSLDQESLKKIVSIELNKLMKRLGDLKLNFSFDDKLVEHISKVGFDEVYGARPIKRAIQDEVEDLVSESVLSDIVKEGGTYTLSVEDEKVVIK
jgi:ATP-dependent Clp protease ATP-binding subunit ClpC